MMLTVKQAAASLGVSEQIIRSILPELGAVDLLNGKSRKRLIRIPEDKLDAYLKSCRIQTAAAPAKTTKPTLDLSLFEPDGRIKRRHSS